MFGGRLPETENKKIYQTSWQIARPIMTVAVHLIAGKHGGTFGMSSSLGEGGRVGGWRVSVDIFES